MRSFALAGPLLCVALIASVRDASACGAPFGRDTTVKPEQTVVVSYANGEQRYELNPSFCGKGADFGLVLPLPAAPSRPVTLGDPELRPQLDALTAPKVLTTYHRYCPSGSKGDDAAVGGVPNRGAGSDGDTKGPGVDVIDAGTVGFLDYEVIAAESAASLTAYLDANAFPYDEAARAAFSAYVSLGWTFVAFKVSAGPTAPPAGKELCGAVGPLAVTFPVAQPVIPTRIVTTSTQQRWRVYTIADDDREPVASSTNASGLTFSKSFSGPVSADDLTHYPALPTVARAGQRITRHEVQFYGSGTQNPQDLTLRVALEPRADYRLTAYRTENIPDEEACSGCAIASLSGEDHPRSPEGLAAALLVAGAIFLARKAAFSSLRPPPRRSRPKACSSLPWSGRNDERWAFPGITMGWRPSERSRARAPRRRLPPLSNESSAGDAGLRRRDGRTPVSASPRSSPTRARPASGAKDRIAADRWSISSAGAGEQRLRVLRWMNAPLPGERGAAGWDDVPTCAKRDRAIGVDEIVPESRPRAQPQPKPRAARTAGRMAIPKEARTVLCYRT